MDAASVELPTELRSTPTVEPTGARSANGDEEPEIVERPRRTAWSMLSSFAIHSTAVAAVLIAVTLQPKPPRGVADFETIAFVDEAPLSGGKTAKVSEQTGEQLIEGETAIDRSRNVLESNETAVHDSVKETEAALLDESTERVVEKSTETQQAVSSELARVALESEVEKRLSEKLKAEVEALEQRSRTQLEAGAVVLPNPGADSDGRTLFSTVGKKNVIFVIDVSGSMSALLPVEGAGVISALEYVKAELIGLIRHQITSAVRFNIIIFSNDARAWSSRLERGHGPAREQAIEFVRALMPGGGTNFEDALELSLKDAAVEEIIVLSDGFPSVGTTHPNLLLDAIRSWTRSRKIPIHTIAFAQQAFGRDFMKRIADETGGAARAFP